nr:MAG TPA: hypothetical protein [Caudoviricetes sp.]
MKNSNILSIGYSNISLAWFKRGLVVSPLLIMFLDCCKKCFFNLFYS